MGAQGIPNPLVEVRILGSLPNKEMWEEYDCCTSLSVWYGVAGYGAHTKLTRRSERGYRLALEARTRWFDPNRLDQIKGSEVYAHDSIEDYSV